MLLINREGPSLPKSKDMAYRFTDTEKWGDPWFVDLKPTEKLLFLYIADMCDVAGFMEISVRRMCFDLGLTESGLKGALKGLERGLIIGDDKGIIYLRNFIKNQKNLPLNPRNKAHRGIIRRFEKYAERFDLEVLSEGVGIDLFTLLGIDPEEYKKERGFKGASKPLKRGTGIGKGNNNIFTNSIKEGVIGGEPEPEEESEIIEVEEIDPFRDFQRWISANAPQVAKMKEPFTREQYLKILEDYNEADVLRILESMHNYKPLLTKCVSANLTARNWLRRDNVPKGGGSRPVNGINNNSRSKISNIKNTLEEALTDL